MRTNLLIFTYAFISCISSLFGQIYQVESSKIDTKNERHYNFFGRVVDLSENYLAICPTRFASRDDIYKRIRGNVYVYQKSTDDNWLLDTIITNNEKNMFGTSIIVGNEYLIIGAPVENNSKGAVYIYKKTSKGWNMEQVLTSSTLKDNDRFGHYLSIDENTLVIGCISHKQVYVFKRENENWKEIGIIKNPKKEGYSTFGSSVAVKGEFVFINENFKSIDSINSCGIVYVYSIKNNKIECVQDIFPPNPVPLGYFGREMKISNTSLIIGTDDKSDIGGALYYFRLNGNVWEYKQKIESSIPQFSDSYGLSFDMHKNTLAVSAWNFDNKETKDGIVFIYKKQNDTWIEVKRLVPSDSYYFGRFGWSVSINNNSVLVGTYKDMYTEKSDQSQIVYYYNLNNY